MVAARVMTATLEPLEDASVVVLGMAVARICRATNLSPKVLEPDLQPNHHPCRS
jgi:hypothetical protein